MKYFFTPLLLALATLTAPAHPHESDTNGRSDGWLPLFDGKSLDGWIQKNGTASYRVADGTIIGTTAEGSPNSFLTTEKSYSDFELTFEVKLEDPLNSGVQIRSKTKEGEGRVYGPQVEIELTGKNGSESGYIYGEATGKGWLISDADRKPHKHFKDGEWNQYRIVANGPRIQTFINGNAVADLKDNPVHETHASGFIGLQVHGIKKGTGPYSVAWKNIQIKQLTPAANPAVSIFDGTTKGWMITPKEPQIWRTEKSKDGDPALLFRKPSHGYIWYERPLGDFELALEFNMSPGCNSGVFFRTDPKNPVQGGFEIQIYDSHGQKPTRNSAGALYDAKPASITAVKPAGKWNTLKLRAKGPHIIVHMNGKKIQDLTLDDWTTANTNPDGSENKFNTALKDLPRTGHIGFQDHGHDVSYRNITLQEL